LVPLEKLKAGTERTANREFDSRVEVTSGDEFEELATSFNNMTQQLGRQFHALESMAEIDRAILSTTNTEKIVETVLGRVPDIVPCDGLSVAVLDPESRRTRLHVSGNLAGNETPTTFEIESELVRFLDLHKDGLSLESSQSPGFLGPLLRREATRNFVIPVFLRQRLMAALAFGYRGDQALDAEDRVRVRQMVDRMAVALKNADDHWASIIALARTIDAKSPWTAGHSERAAEVAVEIGRELGLGTDELEDLRRGALLHDIGKHAIDPSILDKKGELTDEDWEKIKDHPRRGARILEDLPYFAKSIPVVAQHHECWDGSGYPSGLSGEEIDPLARIYAVADVYDALIMNRPYRRGMKRKDVLELIRAKSGTTFDPRVVDAFHRVMERKQEDPSKKSLYASPLLST
jgi:putative nucleotidyltransferase with HDIG domain